MASSSARQSVEVAVVGAGPGGLATAAVLKRKGFSVRVFERDSIASFWKGQYDRLHLHTARFLSNLPYYHIPLRMGRYVSRDDMVRYLEDYAKHFGLDVQTGVNVERLDRTNAGWTLRTNQGPIDAWAVVVAAGYNRVANVPSWPGLDGFTGELVNAPDYRSARPYEGKSVLVVGAGNTGAELCVDLHEKGAERVWWAVRTPPNIALRDGPIPPPLMGVVLKFLRVPNHIGDAITTWGQKQDIGDLTPYGLEPSPRGMFTAIRVDQIAPIIDVGTIEVLKAGKIHVTKAVERVEGSEVVLADSERIEPDVMITCLGYKHGLEPMIGHLGVLGPNNRPRKYAGGTISGAPRLHFVGYKNDVAGMFREFGWEAKAVAKTLKRAQRNPRKDGMR